MAFLNCRRWPFLLSSGQTAVVLGVHPQSIPILVNARILKPLGATNEGGKNKQRVFAAAQILALREDVPTLSKIVTTLSRHWREKNSRAAGEDVDLETEEGYDPTRN